MWAHGNRLKLEPRWDLKGDIIVDVPILCSITHEDMCIDRKVSARTRKGR